MWCLLIAEKLLSHSQDVTGSVHVILRSTKIFGKWSSSHSSIAVASVDPSCDFGTSSHFFIHKVISWSTMSGLIKFAVNISMTGASFVTISESPHINTANRYRTLHAVIENLLKRNLISEIKVSNIGIAMTRL